MAMIELETGKIDEEATKTLATIKLKAKNYGDVDSAVISAGYYAQKQGKAMYVYQGNSYMQTVWRVSYKSSEYLDPINNTGSTVFSVTPELTVKRHYRIRHGSIIPLDELPYVDHEAGTGCEDPEWYK